MTLTEAEIAEVFAGRFVVTGECWEFQGYRNQGGYGRMKIGKRLISAHRHALSLSLGRPLVGWGLHHCDNRACMRPSHLYEGTAQDNCDDRATRGRTAIGERAGKARLTKEAVVALRKDREAGTSYRILGRRYGISTTAARSICIRRNWASV